MKNKIGLGTVQWGLNYGISNSNGIPSDEELKLISTLASNNDIDCLDTATGYGNAEERIGINLSSSFKIVTKIGKVKSEIDLKNQLNKSFTNLKRSAIYGCLFHDYKELINNKDLWKALSDQKSQGKIKKIGYSLYAPNELQQLLELNYIPDIIQIPFNVFDRKFSPYFNFLKEKNVEIHARSIFLQGLLLKSEKSIPEKVKGLKEEISLLNTIADDAKKSLLEVCLGYVKQQTSIDKLILGIETSNQLKQILSADTNLTQKTLEIIDNIQVREKKLLNPSTWQ